MNRVYKSTKREKPVSPLVSYWRRLDKPLILAALLCSLLSIILLYSIWQNHIISSVGASYYRTQLLSCYFLPLTITRLSGCGFSMRPSPWC